MGRIWSIDDPDWPAEVARIQAIQQRLGSCCGHSAAHHVWLTRDGVLYSTACDLCECCYWKELTGRDGQEPELPEDEEKDEARRAPAP